MRRGGRLRPAREPVWARVMRMVRGGGGRLLWGVGARGEISRTITNSNDAIVLTITGAGDKLKLDGVSAADTLSFNGSNGTLELASAGTLTLAAALAIG